MAGTGSSCKNTSSVCPRMDATGCSREPVDEAMIDEWILSSVSPALSGCLVAMINVNEPVHLAAGDANE